MTALAPTTSSVGPGSPCAWCEQPIPGGKRSDSRYDTKRCRQAAWRFALHRVAAAEADTPMRIAYADPPYPGKAHLYRDHPDYAGEVDHRALVVSLSSYDGWALSTSSEPGLQLVLAVCAELGLAPRVGAWVRGGRRTQGCIGAWREWEPVVYVAARSVALAGVSDTLDWTSRPRTSDPHRVVGMKPARFAFWLFQLLGARAGDQLADLFPGSRGIERAWGLYCEGDSSGRSRQVAQVLGDGSRPAGVRP